MVIDKGKKAYYVLEFKRTLERYGGAQEKLRQREVLQHDSLVRGLSTVLERGEWWGALLVFVGGMWSSVEAKAFNTKKKLMGVFEGERDAIRKRNVWKLLERAGSCMGKLLWHNYAHREGFNGGGKGGQGQSGFGREHAGHGLDF